MLEPMEPAAMIFALCATIWLTLGLGLSQRLKKQPARAHGILVASQIGALLTPVVYLAIQQANWGLLPSRAEITQAAVRSRGDLSQSFAKTEPISSLPRENPQLEPIVPTEANAADPVAPLPEIAGWTEPVREIPNAIVPQEPDLPVTSGFSFNGLVLGSWFVVSALMLSRLCLDFLAGYRLARKSRPLCDDLTLREMATLARKLNLTSAPEIALSEEIPSPVLWGWSWPARILIPAATGTREDFRGVYLHELAHLARRDHLSALIGEIVCCLIPWHPLAWWTKKSMEARAEEACDDWAIACGCQAEEYAEELVQLAPSRAGVLTMAAVSQNSRLKSRVSRLLQGAFFSPCLGRGWIAGVGLAALLFTGFLSILQPRLVQAGAGVSASEQTVTEQPQGSQATPSATNTTEIVIMAEGQPAKDASVWVMIGYDDAGEAKFLGPQRSDSKGRTPFPVEPAKVEAAYALDQQGRLAVASLRNGPKKISDFRLSLEKPRSIEAVVTHLGKPVAGVEFETINFYFLETVSSSITYPPGFPQRVLKSDEMGRVRFTHVPRKWGIFCRVADPRFAWFGVYLNPEIPNSIDLIEGGSLRYVLEGAKESTEREENYWSLTQKKQENQAVFHNRFSENKNNNPSTPKNLITHLAPGEYTLSFSRSGSVPYTFGDPQTVVINQGKTTTVAVAVKPAALIKGRFVDSESGEGIPRLRFNLQSTDDDERKKDFVWGQTDEKGFYRVYVRGKGHYGIVFVGSGQDSDRYQPPPYDSKTRSNGVHGEVGEAATATFPDVAMTRAAVIRAKTHNQTHPDSKEPIQILCPVLGSKSPNGMADSNIQDGGFQIRGIPSGVPLSVRIRQGKAVNIPESLTPAQWAEVPTLTLNEANGVTFVGMVQDRQCKPLPRAKVKLFWNYPVQGRDSRLFTSKLMEEAETDEQGKFRCVGYWPNESFYLSVECDGYQPAGEDFNATKKGEPGDTVDFGTFRLTRTNATVQGKVVGVDGKPIAGLTVCAAGHAEKSSVVPSDDKGQFQINQLPEGPGILLVRGNGVRSTYAPFPTEGSGFTIVVRRLSDSPQGGPVIADANLAARKKMIRHMLESLWKSRAENGWGRSILDLMNQFDRARAREWADQLPAQEKQQWQIRMALSLGDDQIVKLTKENVEDGIAAIGQSGRNPSNELIRLGQRFLKEDKEIALRFAEELALRARRQDPNETARKAVYLAEAGELAWNAGNQVGGRKLIEEAIASLKKNPQHRSFQGACGEVASSLAVIDWSEAKKLLDICSDRNYFNSGLSACIKKLAVKNPDEAIKKLDLIKADGSFIKSSIVINLARILAPQDFPKALSLIERLQGEASYAQGLVELALKIHPTHPRAAHKLIEQAFDYLDSQETAFFSWSNFGGRPVLAAQIVYFAKKMNYPDLGSLIARSLGYLGESGRDDPESRKQQGLLTAYALAFTDPATAKTVAQMHSSMEALAKDWSQGGRRGKGFLLALIDPETAVTGFDSLAAAGWNSQKVSHAGLSELLESFIKPGDLMENLTRWESLMWRSLERD